MLAPQYRKSTVLLDGLHLANLLLDFEVQPCIMASTLQRAGFQRPQANISDIHIASKFGNEFFD
jgi:hypothetical protein